MPADISLQKYTYEYLLERALSQVPSTVDKREGSIIYDALAPACYVLAEFFTEAYRLSQEVDVNTASGEWLDAKVAEAGISRNGATAAVKRASFSRANGLPANVPIGTRFASISSDTPLYYTIIGTYPEDGEAIEGEYLALCESVGIEGQQYVGNIIPLDYVSDIAVATLGDIIVPGTDTETDQSLRERYLTKVNNRAFSGNIAHYKEIVRENFQGQVGGVQVYPTWNGGGTVKLSIVDSSLMPATPDFVRSVQEAIDPDAIIGYAGTGLGLAPIDHRVTVATPETFTVNVSATVSLNSGYSLDKVKEDITQAIESYFVSLRDSWDDGNDFNEYNTSVYQSQIIRAALSVDGIANITNVTINGSSNDISLEETGERQQIPVLGEVTLNAGT